MPAPPAFCAPAEPGGWGEGEPTIALRRSAKRTGVFFGFMMYFSFVVILRVSYQDLLPDFLKSILPIGYLKKTLT
jgi:hypothetical protein